MPIQYSSTIESKSCDLSVTIEIHDEHHMGASSVFVELSRPIKSVSRFQTTNGDAFFTPNSEGLVIHDACVILFADLASGEVYNHDPPDGLWFTRVRIEHKSLLSDLYDTGSKAEQYLSIPLADIASVFNLGFGRVDDGRFPSAYP